MRSSGAGDGRSMAGATIGRRAEPGHLDDRRQQPGAVAEIGGFEESLLLARFERTNHRERGDQPLAANRGEGLPIGRNPVSAEIGSEALQETMTVEIGVLLAVEIGGITD